MSRLPNRKEIKHVQRVVGSFLYYGRVVDNTILPALHKTSAFQSRPTESTNEKIYMLLHYLATYPNAKVRFLVSNMILCIDPDAAYLVAPKARSCVAAYFHCNDKYDKHVKPTPNINSPVHI